MNEKKVIEINGIKLEVDMRHCKRVDTFKIGDRVKMLISSKEYGGNIKHDVHPAVVVGFENFEALPTIVLAYMVMNYSEAKLHFKYLNSETENVEITPVVDDYFPIQRDDILARMDREITGLEEKVSDLTLKREYFLRNFNEYFTVEDKIVEDAIS